MPQKEFCHIISETFEERRVSVSPYIREGMVGENTCTDILNALSEGSLKRRDAPQALKRETRKVD